MFAGTNPTLVICEICKKIGFPRHLAGYSITVIMGLTTFSVKDVAKGLATTTGRVLTDIEHGKLKGMKLGKNYQFTLRDLERYIGAKKARELFHREPRVSGEVLLGKSEWTEGKVKRCTKCDRLRPASEFERDANSIDWLAPYCKPCKRKMDGRTWPGS